MKKVLLIILDGWGHSSFGDAPDPGNAVEQASVPNFRRLVSEHPNARLACSGKDVGLPAGQMGNSEVGHLNLGAGRVVHQDIMRIDSAIAEGTYGKALGLPETVDRLRKDGGTLQLVGLVSEGGVHSHVRHLEAILDQLPPDLPVHIHCITDGRDTSPTSGAGVLERIRKRCEGSPGWAIATVSGRYFAMDRDHRWERTASAYRAIATGSADAVEPNPGFLPARYEAGVTDEFVPPTVISGVGQAGIHPRDAVVFFNFRADRMRQLAAALTVPGFDAFERGAAVMDHVVSMTAYASDLPMRVAFPEDNLADCLGQVVSDAGLKQLRVAETEKYAHVTYFFNGGREEPFEGESRSLIPSPKVATYDLQPEMSAAGVADAVVAGLESGDHAFILVNFANPDMVGHTGVIPAASRAVEAVDRLLGRLVERVADADGWVALITADHGNCEKMIADDGTPHTAHTTEPVDVILYDPLDRSTSLSSGRLADVAPTILSLMGLPAPDLMTGRSLLVDAEAASAERAEAEGGQGASPADTSPRARASGAPSAAAGSET